MTNSDELRRAVADAIRSAPISTNAFAEADAAIAAYEAHRPRLVAPEGCQCGHDDQCAFAARVEKAEAERDAAEREWGLCEQQRVKAYTAGFIAGRDAAAAEIDCGCTYREQAVAGIKLGWDKDCQQGECFARLAADIRALTPPESKP